MDSIHSRLHDKVALITGAASGIGRAMALLFARQGATVIAVDIDNQGLESLSVEAEGEEGSLKGCTADVTRIEDCERTVTEVIEEFRQLDILCNNAGAIRRASVLELDESEWDHDLALNLKSVFLWSRAVLPQMIHQGGGVILNTGSGWGLTAGARAASYCASKGAVVQLTRAMAIDHGPQGVRVNCLCPGDTRTPLLDKEAQQMGEQPADFFRTAAKRPLGRIGSAEEIADAALFLVCDQSSFMTGATLVVDGGGLAGG